MNLSNRKKNTRKSCIAISMNIKKNSTANKRRRKIEIW